ncbi:MAG: cellulase family glycosylhydrolase [Bdellovibrionaceae bacterium]|nr:cellulase family glycosylhydrolase [Pseudobdellovibrionaceae bacterium]
MNSRILATFFILCTALGCGKSGFNLDLGEEPSQEETPPVTRGAFSLGVNLSGLEIGGTIPGVLDTDYAAPTTASLDYYKSRGLKHIRLPINWERLQPGVNGPLDSDYLQIIEDLADAARTRQMFLLLDVHNSGRRTEGVIGSPAVPVTALADLWLRVAEHFADHTGIEGYDLMNEPHHISEATWVTAAQAAILAIRTEDDTKKIYVEGANWASSWNFESTNPTLHTLKDPKEKLVFSAHCYLDRDNSGSHFIWADEVAAGSSSPVGAAMNEDIGLVRLASFANWLEKHGFQGHIGEIGTGHENPAWLTALDRALNFAREKKLEVHYWAGGPRWGDYGYSVEAGVSGQADARQMAVLTKYTEPSVWPTRYLLSGPTRGTGGTPSAAFTVEYRGLLKANVTVTPNDGGQGGVFTPATLTLTPGFNPSGSFTYTPNGAKTHYITLSNSGGWTNPAPHAFSSQADLFMLTSVAPTNIFALRKIYAPYIGPLIRLARDVDGAQMDFGYTTNGELDRQAIVDWAGGDTAILRVIRWYDQSPAGAHMLPVYSNTALGFSSPRDYPLFRVNDGDGHPVIIFDANRADFESKLQNVTGHSILARANHRAGGRLLSAQFETYFNFLDDGGKWTLSMDTVNGPYEELDMGVVADQWHDYAGTFHAGTANGWKSFVDGGAQATATSINTSFSMSYGLNTYNVGYFRWWDASRWYGKVRELVLFDGVISDTLVQDFHLDTDSYYATPLTPLPVSTNPVIIPMMGPVMPTTYKGVNLSGLEYNSVKGYPNYDYALPSAAEIDYFAAKGMTLIRLPFDSDRLQPRRFGALNPGFLKVIDDLVQQARMRGMWVVLDPHTYGYLKDDDGTDRVIGVDPLMPSAALADFWSRLAGVYINQPNVIFGLMNEPHNQTAAQWKAVAVDSINAIRATGSTHLILVPGTWWSGAHSWIASGNAAEWSGFSDVNFAYEVHQYLDSDSSGTHAECHPGVSARLDDFMTWVKNENAKGFLGEFGWSQDASCPAEVSAFMTKLGDTDAWMGWSYWTAGPWMDNYMFSVQPTGLGTGTVVDKPPLTVLQSNL